MSRTFCGINMNGARLWLAVAALQAAVLAASGARPHRRSMPTPQALPLSKGGWRPVIGSSGLVFNFGTAPLHAPAYKIPVPVLDTYQSHHTSARPLSTRDATKLTSIAQSYRPTTLRSLPAGPAIPAASQPINTYLNPFAIQSNGLTHYKYVQNFPSDSVIIRNPHNPYAARPVFSKYPNKFKQQYMQQLTNIQPVQFGQQTSKPLDGYGKPLDGYGKPSDPYARTEKKPLGSADIETYKPEVYKLNDNDPASQQVTQQVKTAQQSLVTQKVPVSAYPQYSYQDLSQSFLGSFGSYSLQPVKGRDPLFPAKTTFYPPQTSKQTLFNSYSFAPNFRTTPAILISTTPKLQTTANQIHFDSNWSDYIKNVPTQAPKPIAPAKIDPNTSKGTFKPSPQDPFINKYRASTYPTIQPTTFSYSNFHEYKTQHNSPMQVQQNYYNMQQEAPVKKKHKIHDSQAQLTNQQTSQQYASPPNVDINQGTQNSVPFRATYDVTELYDDGVTHSSPAAWSITPVSQKVTEEAVTKQEYDTAYSRPLTSPPDLAEEYAIVTEGEKGYENSLSYDNQVETQSRRPPGDEFEPIGKHKLKDYYYKVSTPTYEDPTTHRTRKPSEAPKITVHEVTTPFVRDELAVEPLPTLAPSKHFKRPSSTTTQPPTEKERVRKRNKLRRRRPPLSTIHREPENGTRKYPSSTEPSYESHTIKPRLRPTQGKQHLTTPTTSTDLSTSAVPTVSPTSPTIVKKKLVHRRLHTTTTTERAEPTTYRESDNKRESESPIMKISASSRPHLPKISSTQFEYRTSDVPDYTHKQDEKDTPTSDIAVSLSDAFRTTSKTDVSGPSKTFSFHRDARPIEAKLEPVRESTTDSFKESNDEFTTTAPTETTPSKIRPRIKNKYNRTNFSVKDYRNRLSSTTSTTEKPVESHAPKIRFPQRRLPVSDNETTTERKKFTPKDPRQKQNGSEINEQLDKEVYSTRPNRNRQTVETTEATTQKMSSRIRNGSRRPRPDADQTTETSTTAHNRRPLRKKIKDSDQGESVQDVSVTDTTSGSEMTSERTRSESAIMKIADKKHHDHTENIFEHSKRVSDLTLAASKDYNTPGMFKTVAASSRRIPNYFTIATDDPILPIEAFFPQINQKKET